MKVLIVDDSVVFRTQIKNALDGISDIEVTGSAANGKIALAKILQEPVDLITLDYEMPEMDGLQTIQEIRRLGLRTRIVMFSSSSQRGASVALDALKLGADDVIAKPSGDSLNFENAAEAIRKDLVPKILQFLPRDSAKSTPIANWGTELAAAPLVSQASEVYRRVEIETLIPDVVLIGCSTGGPQTLENLLANFSGPGTAQLTRPLFIVQHMPPVFTEQLAARLKQCSGLDVREAKQMELVEKSRVYIAPGDFHMTFIAESDGYRIRLDQGPQINSVRPAVDNLFESAARYFRNKAMGIVLTGMGEDGCRGAKSIKQAGGGIAIQEKDSCVVYGMPGAIHQAKAFDQIMSLEQIRKTLERVLRS
jgi:two-component system chemotaxis response regulator CheB